MMRLQPLGHLSGANRARSPGGLFITTSLRSLRPCDPSAKAPAATVDRCERYPERMARSPRPATSGIIVVDKPLGLSSMDVVRVVRRKAGGAKTGHAGTLDPLATGVLVVCLGKGTKLVERLMDTHKRYLAEVDLTAFTTTDDREGEREEVSVASVPQLDVVAEAVSGFIGEIEQTPPAYSAIKIEGRRAYRMARRGEIFDPPARVVRIDHIEIICYEWPLLTIDVRCGKGTYIRSLARDLGSKLGTGGHLASLRRTEIGPFTLAQSHRLDDVPEPLGEADLLHLDAVRRLLGAEHG